MLLKAQEGSPLSGTARATPFPPLPGVCSTGPCWTGGKLRRVREERGKRERKATERVR